MDIVQQLANFMWSLPLALLLWHMKSTQGRLLKIEQHYVPKEEIEEFIESRTSHLEEGLKNLERKIDSGNSQITEMRIEFARWQERLENRSRD